MQKPTTQYGFTLLELILTMVLVSIVVVFIGEILTQGYKTFRTEQNISQADWQGLLVLQTMTNDIHNIRAAAEITSISSASLTFVDLSGTTVTYSLSGTTLSRNSITLATGVTSFALSFFDKNGSTTSTPSSVRYVFIALTTAQNNISLGFSTLVGTRGMS